MGLEEWTVGCRLCGKPEVDTDRMSVGFLLHSNHARELSDGLPEGRTQQHCHVSDKYPCLRALVSWSPPILKDSFVYTRSLCWGQCRVCLAQLTHSLSKEPGRRGKLPCSSLQEVIPSLQSSCSLLFFISVAASIGQVLTGAPDTALHATGFVSFPGLETPE